MKEGREEKREEAEEEGDKEGGKDEEGGGEVQETWKGERVGVGGKGAGGGNRRNMGEGC